MRHITTAKQYKFGVGRKSNINRNLSYSINCSGKNKKSNAGSWEQTTSPTRHCISTGIRTHVHFCVKPTFASTSGKDLGVSNFFPPYQVLRSRAYLSLLEVQRKVLIYQYISESRSRNTQKELSTLRRKLGVPAAPQSQLAASWTFLTEERPCKNKYTLWLSKLRGVNWIPQDPRDSKTNLSAFHLEPFKSLHCKTYGPRWR